MIGCDSDELEERQVAGGRPSSTNEVQRCLDEKLSGESTSSRCRQVPVPIPDIESCIYTHPPSPIYRLPADVLHTIFELYCEVELHVDFPLRFSPPQFIVSQTCSVWRQIVLDTPAFWNKITITFQECAHYDKMVEVSRMWLSRAKDFPCFIDFNFLPLQLETPVFNRYPLWQHDINKNLVRDLISLHKCRGLNVMFADHHLHDLLQLGDEKLSYIEVLRLRYVHDDNNRETVSPLDLQKLSNLTSFSLVPTYIQLAVPVSITKCPNFEMFSGMPWHQLRHIHLHVKLPALRCLNILETCSPVLETCYLVAFEDLSFASSPPSQIKPVHCPQLRKFKCQIYPNIMLTNGDSFLLCLRLPKLKSLELRCPKNSKASIDPQTLCSMQSVCTMHLEELVISDYDCDVDGGALLASMPSLRCLGLPKKSMFTVDAIRKLGAGSIGPLLEELTIKNRKISNKIAELIQMVTTRSSPRKETNANHNIMPTPLRTVSLYCEDPDKSLRQKYDATIDEINQSGVEFYVDFLNSELLRTTR
ncbi:hypothetical protein M378DRAFT_387925 [Amanita muscaria Koide BX008]|uniref:Uncharacterized protein n=1 Tax=Amanita muscaria (strain Koide BX008) TaxID=946122 RepID=A0A0C2XC15_AMAMK|nr:hypothetical protein M378DRAFT_387925 [Amanita muscaria Koide BX008]